jgi:hypothetical protein
MGLLRADLTAIANLPATAQGRRLAVSTCFGLGLLALMWWSIAQAILHNPHLLQHLHGRSGDSLRGLLGTGLMPCPIAATWLGLALAQRQLFETPELLLWRASPIPAWRGPVQVLLRAILLSTLWATALSLPFVATLLSRTQAGPLAWVLAPVAIVGCTAPPLCVLLALQIVLVRFFAGGVLRFVLTAVAALASVAFSAWLLIGLFAPQDVKMREVAALAGEPGRLPWTIASAASLLDAAATGRFDGGAMAAMAGWLSAAAAIIWVAARLHPKALERHLESRPPMRRRLARWPTSIAAVVRRKELAQVLQQPGALIGFVVFAVLVFAMARERVFVGGILSNEHLPREVATLGGMLAMWFVAVLLVLYAHMGRLALWDGAQWSLYMTAPASPGAILRGKLQAVLIFLMWPLVLVGAAGRHFFGASDLALVTFAGIAFAGTLAALGALAVVGTWPRLMRPDDGGQIVQGGRSFFAAIVLVLVFEFALSPALYGWLWMQDYARLQGLGEETARRAAPWVVGGAWLLGAVVGALGVAIGARNFRRLSSPR